MAGSSTGIIEVQQDCIPATFLLSTHSIINFWEGKSGKRWEPVSDATLA